MRKRHRKLYMDICFYSLAFCSCILFMVLMANAYGTIDNYACMNGSGKLPLIVIDAGHGGEDGGAQSADGILEKDINLLVAKGLNSLLKVSGFETRMIREEDISIYDDNAGTTRQKKLSDLNNRVKIINENPNAILISIHQNKFTDSKYYGSQMFYATNMPESRQLAEAMKKSFVGLLQPDNTREIKPAGKEIFLLRKSTIPSVIIECGFLSNEAEAAKLNTEEYQKQLAFAAYCGLMDYLNHK